MATPDISISELGRDFPAHDEDIAQMFQNLPGEGDDVQTEKKDNDVKEDEGKENAGPGIGESGDDHDDDLDDDQRGGKSQEELDAATPEAAAAAREKKRGDRLNQRQRQRQRIDTLERNLANALAQNQEAHQRLAQLENSNLSGQMAALQQQGHEVGRVENELKDILADATVKGDGVRAAEATQALIQVQRRKELLEQEQQHMTQVVRQASQPQRQQLDPESLEQARSFMQENSWYKGPKSDDPDSKVLAMFDNQLTREGWNPRLPAYYTELKRRAGVYLQHRWGKNMTNDVQDNSDQVHNGRQERRSTKQPVAGSGSNGAGSNGGQNSESYRVNGERVRAMKEAGIWDDLERRLKMIKRYQLADKEAAANKS